MNGIRIPALDVNYSNATNTTQTREFLEFCFLGKSRSFFLPIHKNPCGNLYEYYYVPQQEKIIKKQQTFSSFIMFINTSNNYDGSENRDNRIVIIL
jgi:hypothetical protein